MHRALPTAIGAAALALLAACSNTPGADPFAPHEVGEPSTWGQGLEGFSSDQPVVDDTGGDGGDGGSDVYDGTWEGTYDFSAYLSDLSTSCACSAALTMVIEGGNIEVGFGETCSMDCGINSQMRFNGSVASDGTASGEVEENTSFYFTSSWSGTFSADEGTGSFNEAGLSTSQGTTDVSGSFTVTPAAR